MEKARFSKTTTINLLIKHTISIQQKTVVSSMMKQLTTLATILVFFLSSHHTEAVLQVGFYSDKCQLAETIIRNEVVKAFVGDKGIAPGLVRLHFHDCFVRGCDGSILIDTTSTNKAEKDGAPNGRTLRGLEVIDNAKARLEAECAGVVSCADILAFAARDSIVLTGLYWDVPAGRRDGRISRAEETVDIPGPSFNLDQMTQSFAEKGLTQDDLVALLGAHTIGRTHCTAVTPRLYNYSSKTSQDPNLNPLLAKFLSQKCPINSEGEDTVFMNQTPLLMDSSYYANLFLHNGLFDSDQALLDSSETTQQVAFYATHGLAWQHDFVQAMVKMSQIQVLTGAEGEIRTNCRLINA
ncbi:peroxidase 5-like [Silene latifolia]|uniref:peroxidase 5-like n=1 Tax=Silene latifolia TaxID=37657 RepID=UPI003D77C8E7